VLALTPEPTAEPLDTVLRDVGERVALVLGGEGDGLSDRWLSEADHRVRIRQRSTIDSLNVAAAAAIACYALSGTR
jgi:tRNA G18 (ribose-2'-O)-methylase SpoU